MKKNDVLEIEATELPLLPLRNMVLFPGTLVSVTVGRAKSVEIFEKAQEGDLVVVGVQREKEVEDPTLNDVHDIATVARIHKVIAVPTGGYAVALEGVERFRIESMPQTEPYWTVTGETLTDDSTLEHEVYATALRDALDEMVAESGGAIEYSLPLDDAPGLLADRVAAALDVRLDVQIEALMTTDVDERLRLVTRLIGDARTKTEIKHSVESEVRKELNKAQREHLLRQQLKAIQKELGDAPQENDELTDRLAAITFPEDAQEAVDREISRLAALQPGQAEYNVVRNYLEWMADLPWDNASDESVDIDAMHAQLESDHYGLEDVKKRILEHMAVMQLSGNPRGTILCLAGPPGVGKTSLGRSIADATGRPFVRIALGGVRDESEIRGHRRTYVGSRPGRIVHALRKAGANNPVMLLDEVDKLGKGWAGDPEAALLEVLDPEQNDSFQDHFLEVPFDLSNVLFLVTANDLANLSRPLRDRLEIIEVSGYTIEEKTHIARNHLIPKQLKAHSIPEDVLEITPAALSHVVAGYTREAGVRQLQRLITKLCRVVALEVVRSGDIENVRITVDADDVETYLGKVRFFNEVASRTSVSGVATGLAWTPVGGDILFVETSKMPGTGQLKITGQLGDVMQESAHAALTYIRSRARDLDVDPAFTKNHDVHIHVPAGAVPKDGPSAGVTMFTALTSLMTDRRVRSDTAMTGECTLRGQVLPVGGIKSKVLAAHRAGIRRIILPKRNVADLDEVPANVLADLEIFPVEDMDQVLAAALEREDNRPIAENSAPTVRLEA